MIRQHWTLVEELAKDIETTDGALKNLAPDLTAYEMASQVSTILLAGHDTTVSHIFLCHGHIGHVNVNSTSRMQYHGASMSSHDTLSGSNVYERRWLTQRI
jgi:hypothetical protein